jgi:hypothetical protein
VIGKTNLPLFAESAPLRMAAFVSPNTVPDEMAKELSTPKYQVRCIMDYCRPAV